MPNEKLPTILEVRFIGDGLSPDQIPLRAVSDALSAVQDLASGRDPFIDPHVPPERSIGLVDVRSGSAVYACVAHAPEEAKLNLGRVGGWLSIAGEGTDESSDGLVAALPSIESLSTVARSLGCRLEISLPGRGLAPFFTVDAGDYKRISGRLLLKGETTVVGTVEKVGGAGETRCQMRVPGRRRALYCNVAGKELARRLGHCLYQTIAATGSAVWIHRSWRIYKFTIKDFEQPRLGDPDEAIKELRKAGLDAWDQVEDPDAFIRELRS